MPGRPRQHELETDSLRAFEAALPVQWTTEPVSRDYGLDVRVEIFEEHSATGLAFWVQLKATDEPDLRRALRESFKVTTLNYLAAQADPVLLVRFHASSRRLFGMWLHRQTVNLKRHGQRSVSLRWTLAQEIGGTFAAEVLGEVRRFRRLGSPPNLPLSVRVNTSQELLLVRPAALALLRTALVVAPLQLTEDSTPDLVLSVAPTQLTVDTPLAMLRAEVERSTSAADVADNIVVALAAGLAAVGMPGPAVDLTVSASRSPLLRNDDVAGRLAQAFASARRWREASDLALDCLTGPPGREFLGRMLDIHALLADRDLPLADARHIADNLMAVARWHEASGENSGAAWYSAGNWLFHAVHDYSAASDAYEAAAQACPDYWKQEYWVHESAAALFESGLYQDAASRYDVARALLPRLPDLEAKIADCLAHAGDRDAAIQRFDRYVTAVLHPSGVWELKRLALEALADSDLMSRASTYEQQEEDAAGDGSAAAPDAATAEPVSAPSSDDEGDDIDWDEVVHPGLGVAQLLRSLHAAAADDNPGDLLAAVTVACAFPSPGAQEPWGLLLRTAWELREALGDDWPVAGAVFRAGLEAAWHRRGDGLLSDLLRDPLQEDGLPMSDALLAEIETRLTQLGSATTRTVRVRSVRDDGSREVLEIGLTPRGAG